MSIINHNIRTVIVKDCWDVSSVGCKEHTVMRKVIEEMAQAKKMKTHSGKDPFAKVKQRETFWALSSPMTMHLISPICLSWRELQRLNLSCGFLSIGKTDA